jgi:uncharacterized UPF0146 family protein
MVLEKVDLEDHWDKVYQKRDVQNWSELDQPRILNLIKTLNLRDDAVIFLAGVGDSSIVYHLSELGFRNIIANDISQSALDLLARKYDMNTVTFVKDDLTNPKMLDNYYQKIDLYIDRATLHFFKKEQEIQEYFGLISSMVKKGGHCIISVFDETNKPKCSGLDLKLWSLNDLEERIPDFKTEFSFSEFFRELNGNKRKYIHLLSNKYK